MTSWVKAYTSDANTRPDKKSKSSYHSLIGLVNNRYNYLYCHNEANQLPYTKKGVRLQDKIYVDRNPHFMDT